MARRFFMKAARYLIPSAVLGLVLLLAGIYAGGHPDKLPGFMQDSFLVKGGDTTSVRSSAPTTMEGVKFAPSRL